MIPDSISPKDVDVMQKLKQQEQIGEQGFAVYYRGDEETGMELMKQALEGSTADIRTLKNSYLREHAEQLMKEMGQAIQNYMKKPCDENLDALKVGAENYKSFLDQY
jgi:hypothetical protein